MSNDHSSHSIFALLSEPPSEGVFLALMRELQSMDAQQKSFSSMVERVRIAVTSWPPDIPRRMLLGLGDELRTPLLSLCNDLHLCHLSLSYDTYLALHSSLGLAKVRTLRLTACTFEGTTLSAFIAGPLLRSLDVLELSSMTWPGDLPQTLEVHTLRVRACQLDGRALGAWIDSLGASHLRALTCASSVVAHPDALVRALLTSGHAQGIKTLNLEGSEALALALWSERTDALALDSLNVSRCALTDEQLQQVAIWLNVQHLNLAFNRFTDQGIRALLDAFHVHGLDIRGNDLTLQGVEQIKRDDEQQAFVRPAIASALEDAMQELVDQERAQWETQSGGAGVFGDVRSILAEPASREIFSALLRRVGHGALEPAILEYVHGHLKVWPGSIERHMPSSVEWLNSDARGWFTHVYLREETLKNRDSHGVHVL